MMILEFFKVPDFSVRNNLIAVVHRMLGNLKMGLI